MNYIDRELTKVIKKASGFSPVIMITGSRQVGKTTLLLHIEPKRNFVTLDDLEIRFLAQNDPKTFLDRFPAPVLIDEFQYAPQILPYIKIAIDKQKTRLKELNGAYWLTGSQNFSMMDGVQESLAGRVSILNLLGLSKKEIGHNLEFEGDFLAEPANNFQTNKEMVDIFEMILFGDRPELWANKAIDKEIYYRSYVQTYIERDVVSYLKIKDIGLFEKFLRLLASRVGQLVNFTSLSQELGLSLPTIKSWLTILERSFQIFLLPAYYRNIGKRAIKTSKVYFFDLGLVTYFLRFSSAKEIMTHYLAGGLFENWVISELVKSYWFKGKSANFYFWRTKDGKEIDLLYEYAGKIYPVEIKLTASPDKNLFIPLLDATKQDKLVIGRKKIICASKINLPIDKETDIVSAMSIM